MWMVDFFTQSSYYHVNKYLPEEYRNSKHYDEATEGPLLTKRKQFFSEEGYVSRAKSGIVSRTWMRWHHDPTGKINGLIFIPKQLQKLDFRLRQSTVICRS